MRVAPWLALLTSLVFGFSVHAQTAPKLASVTPVDGATLVPTTASLVFVFDQEMDTTVPLFQSIPNAIAGNFEVTAPGFNQSLLATWGADKKSFTLKAVIQFPYATFTWRLNPTGSLFPLKGKNGLALATVSGTFSTGVGGTVPVLAAANPATDSIGVPPSQVVSFSFDQAMKTNTAIAGNPPSVAAAISWSGAGIEASKFRYTWSANSRVLFCDYEGNLPVNTEILWELNPAAAPVKLENPAGLAVPTGMYAGHFTTGSGIPCNPPTTPPNMGFFTLFKSSSFIQDSASEPVPMEGGSSFTFGAIVQAAALGPNPVSASLTAPNGTVTPLTSFVPQTLQHGVIAATEEEFEAAAPAGTYTMRFVMGTQPEASVPMTVPALNPPVPRITNFDAAQAIRADADFTLAWNPFTGASATDYISITLIDDRGRVRFTAPDPCVPRELLSTATSVVIPAKTLATNSVLSGTIVFNRSFYSSTNAVPNMGGYGSVTRSTQFVLRTQGGGGGGTTPTPARLTHPQRLSNGHPQFIVEGAPGSRHAVQRTTGLGSTATPWLSVQTVTLDAAGSATFEDAAADLSRPAYYRAQAE
ncbi:MAG: hypothetical protein IT580_01920 [Verrucomicrobiales bacterium]|nr:hypothetical protein [Verrucomicrobiales bacterium]